MREPDARDAAAVLLAALAAMLVAWLFVMMGLPPAAVNPFLQVAFFGAPLLAARARGLAPLAASGFVRLSLRQAAFVLLASLASFWVLFAITKVQAEILRVAGYQKLAELEEEMIRKSLEMSDGFPVRALAVFAVIPPICEETLFRGILLRGIRSRFGPAVALAATSVLFAAVHPTVSQRGMMLFLGCYFGALVHLTGSLWAGILAHAVNNAGVVLMTWIFGPPLKDMPIPWGMLALAAVVFGIAIVGLSLERRAPGAV